MQHDDHVALIRDGVLGAGPRWLELGAGEGAFTLALADLLGNGGHIVALDRDRWPLTVLTDAAAARFPGTPIHTVTADFTRQLPAGPFDGVLAANSLHFVADPRPVLDVIRTILSPHGRLVLVEYDADRGNPYVPHPISFRRWRGLAGDAGFGPPYLLHRVPSRFLGSIYAAAAARGPGPAADPIGPVTGSIAVRQRDPADRVVHSRPHGDDREE
jgi:ubiquinone/menaquinone biosynthesis C-methylase UbiE